MKTKLCIWIGLIAFTAGAANLIVVIPTNDIPRVQAAFRAIYGMDHDPSMQEVSDITRMWIISQTYGLEGHKNAVTYSPTPLEMVPTPTPTVTATATATATLTPTPTATATP